MKVIKPSVSLLNKPDYQSVLTLIEKAGRICYKSEPKGEPEKFIKRLIDKGHESVLEHQSFTFHIVTDRAIANELVRHRIASYSQESTRYVKYDDLEAIIPSFNDRQSIEEWYTTCCDLERTYQRLIEARVSPQMARSILPLSLKTELIMTANIREWRHIFRLRISPAAHPDMSSLMRMCWKELFNNYPIFFDDIGEV